VSLEDLSQAQRLALAWLLIAGTVAAACWLFRRRDPGAIGWSPVRTPWVALDIPIFLAMIVMIPAFCAGVLREMSWWKPDGTNPPQAVVQTYAPILGGAAGVDYAQDLHQLHLLNLWTKLFAFPALIILTLGLLHLTERRWPSVSAMPSSRKLALTLLLWLLSTPCIFLLNLLVNGIMTYLGNTPDVHPLTRAGTGNTIPEKVLFIISACCLSPLFEEFLFRGVLINWAVKSRWNPWGLIGIAVFIGPLLKFDLGPTLYLILAASGLFVLQKFSRFGKLPLRHVGAIWSSAALFGAIHMNVWPSPIPLFLLGLVLGYLCLRTGSWLCCALFHGLFNGISTLSLLLT
jgi:membrane protease YdiL (CAAX protease family)